MRNLRMGVKREGLLNGTGLVPEQLRIGQRPPSLKQDRNLQTRSQFTDPESAHKREALQVL